ncbi:hypothetical protein D3C80_1629750 [compost metagenome]
MAVLLNIAFDHIRAGLMGIDSRYLIVIITIILSQPQVIQFHPFCIVTFGLITRHRIARQFFITLNAGRIQSAAAGIMNERIFKPRFITEGQ